MSRVSRRGFLIGGAGVVVAGAAGVAGIEAGVIPGRTTLHAILGLNGEAGTIPDATVGPKAEGSFVSRARVGATCAWRVSYPPGSAVGDELPVVVVLHGYDGDHTTGFDKIGLDRFQAELGSPFAIAAVDGGNGYWHARKSGDDSGTMITDEFIPLLADQGLDTSRLGLLGWSMGGYGALLLGARMGPDAVAGTAAESPAMWADGAHSPEGAFDDATDYAAHDLAGHQADLDRIAVRIDCGTGDGFYPVVQKYVDGFATKPAGGFTPGGHDYAYWRRIAPEQLSFLAKQF